MAVRDHGFHSLRVARVVAETVDSASFVLEVPPDLTEAFAYEAGQFCTFRCPVGESGAALRCYSMSSAPGVDSELAVTVKRVPGGLVSNWMIDHLGAGDVVDVTLPAGVFCLSAEGAGSGDLVLFSGGSGITPLFSLAKAALAGTDRRVRLLYANRDRDAVIFEAALADLVAAHPDRLEVRHHLDAESGYLDAASVRSFTSGASPDADVYLCGPTPFMDLVEGALAAAGVPADRIHIERFTPGDVVGAGAAAGAGIEPGRIHIERFTPGDVVGAGAAAGESGADDAGLDAAGSDDQGVASAATQVTIELDGRTETTAHHPGTTLLQTARQVGLPAPSSCEAGSCATCMAKLVDGEVTMYVNNALTDDELAEGWVLTCQSVPTTPAVHVVYGFED